MEAKRHPDMGKRAMYMGISGKIVAVTRSARYANGGYVYSLLPDGERCLSKAWQYLTAQQIDFESERNEILEAVAAHRYYTKPHLVKA